MDMIIYHMFNEKFRIRLQKIVLDIEISQYGNRELFKQYEDARDALEAIEEIGKQRGWI